MKTFTQFSEAYRKVVTHVPADLQAKRLYRYSRWSGSFPDARFVGGVGPHEYIHKELMDRGLKPAAIIHKSEYKKDFHAGVRAGRFIAKRTRHDDYIVGQPGEEWRVKKIHKSLAWTKPQRTHMARNHIRLGRLLGYTKPQIRLFLKGIK